MGSHDMPFFVAGGLSLLTFLFALVLLPESLEKDRASEALKDRHEWVSPRGNVSSDDFKITTYAAFSCGVFLYLQFRRLGDDVSTVH